MQDGAIVQTGTAEELVMHPATDYVAEFTRDVPRAKVMSAERLMQAATPGAEYAGQIGRHAKVTSFAADIIATGRPFAIVDDMDRLVGEVTPRAVTNLLAGLSTQGSGSG
jgi:glycine betaine/proline transport system ATP-binding protein